MSLKYDKILIAIDGSDAAEKAFQRALIVAKTYDAMLILTHIVDTRAYPIAEAYEKAMVEDAKQNAKELLDQYEKKAKEAGINHIKQVLEYGSPRTAITKTVAPNEQADLIIIGATGLNMVERLLVGSVSESVLRHAKCDVLVVR